MMNLLFQTILPFIFSAMIVIIITVIAEKYGTKVGGILGTLPSTIIIAFIFIALNKGILFASISAAVVPAEMGINLIFLFLFTILVHKSTALALTGSLTIWTLLSVLLFFTSLENMLISVIIYIISLITTFLILEKIKKIQSLGNVKVHYTTKKIILRGITAGLIIALAVFLSNIDPTLSGIFSIFPAIFISTMLITVKEHGTEFSGAIAKSMIFGSQSVMAYVISVYLLYPKFDILFGTIYSFLIAFIITLILLKFRKRII